MTTAGVIVSADNLTKRKSSRICLKKIKSKVFNCLQSGIEIDLFNDKPLVENPYLLSNGKLLLP